MGNSVSYRPLATTANGEVPQLQQRQWMSSRRYLIPCVFLALVLAAVQFFSKEESFVESDAGSSSSEQDERIGSDTSNIDVTKEDSSEIDPTKGLKSKEMEKGTKPPVKTTEPEHEPLVPIPSGVPKSREEALRRFRSHNGSYEELYKTQLFFCGELCDTTNVAWRNVSFNYDIQTLQDNFVSKSVDCDWLYNKETEEVLEAAAFEWPPPRTMPLKDVYTFGGRAQTGNWFFVSKHLGDSAHLTWPIDRIQNETEQLKSGTLFGTYGPKVTTHFANILKEVDLTNKSVLVIGSEKPWVEVSALAAGARHVTTLEYGKIVSLDPRISTVRPFEMSELYRNGSLTQLFDVAVSFSSLEHSGLGRYGDGINPWGDLIAMAKASCLVKKKTGYFIIGVPSGAKDATYYNAHRVYGPIRWPLFLTNWWPERIWQDRTGQFENGIVYARNERQ